MRVILLLVIGYGVAAALRPLMGRLARALGLVRQNFAGVTIPTACGWVIVAAMGIGLGISDFGVRMGGSTGHRESRWRWRRCCMGCSVCWMIGMGTAP